METKAKLKRYRKKKKLQKWKSRGISPATTINHDHCGYCQASLAAGNFDQQLSTQHKFRPTTSL
jgi:hypothetical protein